MKKIFAIAISLLFLANSAFGDEPSVPPQKVLGAEKVYNVGDLVQLELSPLEKVVNLDSVNSKWKIRDAFGRDVKYTESKNGGVILGTGARVNKLYVTVAVGYTFVYKNESSITGFKTRVDILDAVVSVGEGPVPTPPEPGPNPFPPTPNPEPTFPEGQFGLAKFTYQTAKTSGLSTEAALEIAKNYENVAARISAGVLKETGAILDATSSLNAVTVGKFNLDKSKFFTPLEDKTFDLYSVKKTLRTPENFSTAYREISEGLKAIK